MDKKNNKKVITVSFVIAGAIAGIVVNVLVETAAAAFGVVARVYSHDLVRHGLPVFTAVLAFCLLQFNSKICVWADEVVLEITKVVWPTKKDTTAMTIVCCVMLLVASVVLGVFDFLSSNLVKLIVN